jgi:hypothetical protein
MKQLLSFAIFMGGVVALLLGASLLIHGSVAFGLGTLAFASCVFVVSFRRMSAAIDRGRASAP